MSEYIQKTITITNGEIMLQRGAISTADYVRKRLTEAKIPLDKGKLVHTPDYVADAVVYVWMGRAEDLLP
jgi:hypothetical protein